MRTSLALPFPGQKPAGQLRLALRRLKSTYLPLIKGPQTALLVSTGLAGYMSVRCPVIHWQTLVALAGSLFLAVSGSTALNMVADRDLDARMQRTSGRPLPSGRLSPRRGLLFGLTCSLLGVGWAWALSPLYGAVIFAGLFFDVAVYSLWLKRRTAWSVVWGGIAGGMPVLAGRALGLGRIDGIGLLLALAVLFWIPAHIMTFGMRRHQDYRRAGIPTFPTVYGFRATRLVIALGSLMAAAAMAAAGVGIGLAWGYLWVLAALSGGLLVLAVGSLVYPSEKLNFGLFKYASAYMLVSMALFVVGAV